MLAHHTSLKSVENHAAAFIPGLTKTTYLQLYGTRRRDFVEVHSGYERAKTLFQSSVTVAICQCYCSKRASRLVVLRCPAMIPWVTTMNEVQSGGYSD